MKTGRELAVRSGIALCAATFALLAAACAAPVDDTSVAGNASATPVKNGSGANLATGLTPASGGNTGSGGATGTGGDSGAGGSASGGGAGSAGAAGTGGGSTGPEPGLAGYWSFEDKGNSIQDASGNQNDGSLAGGVVVSPNGELGSALSFAGSDGRLAIPSASDLDFTGTATIEFWVRLTSVVPGSLVTRISTAGDGVRVRTSQGNLQVTFNQGGAAASVTTNPGVIGPAWAHVAIVNDGANLDVYVDGKVVGSGSGGKLGSVAGDLVVGHSSASDTAINGYFDELKWYSIARTPEEVCKDAAGSWSGTDCQ